MIHHLSLPAVDPRHTADVFSELLGGGTVTRFGPNPDSWIAWSRDEHGTAIEFYPVGTELFPPDGAGQAQFRRDARATGYTATHAAVSVPVGEEVVHAAAAREGWRAVRLDRGGFDVIEFWIDNRVMVELLTADMAAAYLAIATTRR
jgi:hypothetical protein